MVAGLGRKQYAWNWNLHGFDDFNLCECVYPFICWGQTKGRGKIDFYFICF